MPAALTARTWIDLLSLACIWGGSFLAIRVALDSIGPFQIVAARVSLGALTLWLILLALRLPRPSPRRWWAYLGMGLLNNVIPFGLIAWGQQFVETGLAAIVNASTAVWGVLVAALLLADERLTARRAAGVALGFVGVATAIGPSALTSFDPRSLGQLAIVGATVSYAFAGVWGRTMLRGEPSLAASAGMLTGSSLVAIPLALAVEGAPPASLPASGWAAVAYISVAATGIAYLFYWRILSSAGSGNAMLATLLVAPVAIVLGALVRGEALHGSAYAGFALLALGLAVLEGRLLRRKPLAKDIPPG
ncbi:DMT family transporter [Wenxinia marina]|uniref:Permease of the drug/metabolite transporter (DMT) superfamily n=1 Tax=Wenxinia marina DSM 24838 TaxID=1123501 RepID=A0A0D0NH18_9RHOB|nr:DMT family transporter [Wenxinia marina]KIQ67625.1 Permease of the drug/metabolite transporter (DMT) superfamily [Wenxinia marina DSM 24838]GGL80163.1 multidrug transporter [Wenxinia marina]